ncbi:MAG TPA: NFACT RNA binding domain-containing protein [Candidatus Kapabacteria bacterium]|nr:NFACT RNA binding domain-containing protein [Candidatus Kapabacteria bacterium]HPO63405.1 NFACT RNA binding domain-containing protein [Candidatus Kapabacteria bacterium]
MINHYYTLIKLVEELKYLKDFVIIECFTQEKNILMLALYDGKSLEYVQFSALPNKTCLFQRTNFSKSRKNYSNQFPEIIGKKIKNIYLIENERIVVFEIFSDHSDNFSCHSEAERGISNVDGTNDDEILHFVQNDKSENIFLHFILFGASKSNAVLLNKKDFVIDSFKKKSELVKKEFLIPKQSFNFFKEENQNISIIKALTKCDLLLGKYYAEQFLKSCNISFEKQITDLTKKEILELYKNAEEFKNNCIEFNIFYILENEDREELLSLIKLDEFPKVKDSSNSISYLIERKFFSGIKVQSYQNEFKELFTKIEKYYNKLKKRIERIEEQQDSDKESEYKLWAELLLAAPNPKTKQGKQIELFNYEGNIFKIPLDEKFTLLENSQKYFEKSRSVREEKEHNISILNNLKTKEIIINKYLNEMKEIKDRKQLKDFRNKVNSEFKELNQTKENEEHSKFRVFELSGGYMLYVGKSAANNDELTFGLGKPNDYWFHARGSSGSHAILKFNSKDEKPPKDVLKEAASITAYYSQQRNAKYVQVCYTQRKNVYKPKGSAPGSVVLKREEVIMVEPKLKTLDLS